MSAAVEVLYQGPGLPNALADEGEMCGATAETGEGWTATCTAPAEHVDLGSPHAAHADHDEIIFAWQTPGMTTQE